MTSAVGWPRMDIGWPSSAPSGRDDRHTRHDSPGAGIRTVCTPVHAPNANAHAERFVRSIKEECLDRIIPIGERHFRRALTEFVAYYHYERNHQGLGNVLIDGDPERKTGRRIRCCHRLGGLLNYYERAA
jgi:putative transposase